jgi:hypothetical protein
MLSSSSPYPCLVTTRADGRDYEFTTASGAGFVIYFSDETDFFDGAAFADAVVSIGFKPTAGRHTRRGFRVPTDQDPQLFATIAWAIETYLEQYPHRLIVWVCSTLDDQEVARKLLFDRKYRLWCRQSSLAIVKKDLEITARDLMFIVYRADSPFRAELEALLPEE